MKRGGCRIGRRRGEQGPFSHFLLGRAQQASAPTKRRQPQMKKRRRFQISDLRFQIQETANETANSEASKDADERENIESGYTETDALHFRER